MTDNIQQIESFLRQQILPQANRLDTDTAALKLALKQLSDRSLLALQVPQSFGGEGLDSTTYARIQILLARTSGALTFLQTQHQGAVAKLAHSHNSYLQQEFLPQAVKVNTLLGVGFSHLRRPGLPIMQAKSTAGGFLLTGSVPWITGYGFFSHFILGATLADGQELYGLLPFANEVQPSGGTIALSSPLKLLAVSATNTVSATISQWFLPSEYLIAINAPGSIHHSSRRKVLSHGLFALGTAYAGLDLLHNLAQAKKLEFLHESWQTLYQELQSQEQQLLAALSAKQTGYKEKLQLRAAAINLAQRCSLAAVIASSGASNYLHSSAGRIYREAMLFTVSGQTTDVMQASLQSLLG
ncbi:MAG: acyl-CoA dehydrogenase family protein [Cyanobacteria bacterium J06621_8]